MYKNLTNELTLEVESTSATELLVGDEVLQLMSDQNFIEAWHALYGDCEWATVFQSPEFVSVWYQTFHHKNLPILVKEEQGGKLTGLLTLAKNVQGLGITAAGGWDAYYHTWLCSKSDEDRFIKNALSKVREGFKGQKIMFKYIPPKTPLNWLQDDPEWNSRYVMREFKRPVMNFQDPEATKLFKKKQFRENRNRLKRLGELKFEKIVVLDEFKAVLDELIIQFDFRKGATLNKIPFKNNPVKKEFLLALFEQGILHVTVLKLNDEIIASLVATEGKNKWVHGAGINTHSPFYAKYSPGYVIMVMLEQLLFEEGYAAFDLTPGGHAYKERLANSHDQLYELCITSKWHAYTTRFFYDYLKKASMYGLSRAGINPKLLRSNVERKLLLKKEQLKLAKYNGYRSLVRDKNTQNLGKQIEVYRVDASALGETMPVRRNCLNSLLQYKAKGAQLTRWEFLEGAMMRFESGEESYTWLKDGQLQLCLWVNYTSKTGFEKNDGAVAVKFENIYCNPENTKDLPAFIAAVSREIITKTGKQNYYITVNAHDNLLVQSFEQIGVNTASLSVETSI
ncbi:GNAT family N-acetyltransferase [uncultured Pontibacter sp.]|uniref:GNAT family N-acetyltransferase n=1 Tax=uncultured Pontibacter sp. TaxID=453356 RepID=UPI002626559E|nr:GNAT family N-acetyltransferase [uncultured Pontibacter sp.]